MCFEADSTLNLGSLEAILKIHIVEVEAALDAVTSVLKGVQP